MAMIDKIKKALQITTTSCDDELTDIMNAAITDLNIAGVTGDTVSTASTDPIVIKAIIGYAGYQFNMTHGSIDRANAFKLAYDEQKSQLGMASGYTVFGDTAEGE